MVSLRQVVRVAYLDKYVQLRDLPVQSQWSVISVFLVLFVAGLVTVYAMLKKLRHGNDGAKSREMALGD
jgi:hypothetical protein